MIEVPEADYLDALKHWERVCLWLQRAATAAVILGLLAVIFG